MKRVGIVGATGAVGLEAIDALLGHPEFTISDFYASGRSAGKSYAEACRLELPSSFPKEIANRTVLSLDAFDPNDSDIIFSALPSNEAKTLEPRFAEHLPVVSTTSAFRYEPDVPILITEVNSSHAELLQVQQKRRGWKGFI